MPYSRQHAGYSFLFIDYTVINRNSERKVAETAYSNKKKGNGSKMCGKLRGHKPDQIQCCKLRTCDSACWVHAHFVRLVRTSPEWSVWKRSLMLSMQVTSRERGREMFTLCPGPLTSVYLPFAVFPEQSVCVSLLKESEWQILHFFNTVLSLWATLSPHFLSFFLWLSLSLSLWSGLVFLPAWRGLAARPIHPFDHLSLLPLSRLGLVWSRLSTDLTRCGSSVGVSEKWEHAGVIVSHFKTLAACGWIHTEVCPVF